MTDYISRADAIEAVCKAECGLDYNKEKDYCTCTPVELIKALPSADAVSREQAEEMVNKIYNETLAKVSKECKECGLRLKNIADSADYVKVVRCKDCRHNNECNSLIALANGYEYIQVSYCSHGERADKGGDAKVNETKSPYMQQSRPHGRLIDADALANEICKVKRTDNWLGAILVAINNAPTVEVGRPHGEWQVVGYDKDYIPIKYTCSVCGHKFLYDFNFCPDCGADMRGDTE